MHFGSYPTDPASLANLLGPEIIFPCLRIRFSEFFINFDSLRIPEILEKPMENLGFSVIPYNPKNCCWLQKMTAIGHWERSRWKPAAPKIAAQVAKMNPETSKMRPNSAKMVPQSVKVAAQRAQVAAPSVPKSKFECL